MLKKLVLLAKLLSWLTLKELKKPKVLYLGKPQRRYKAVYPATADFIAKRETVGMAWCW